MTIKEFEQSLKDPSPPEILRELLKALWYEARGSWDKAHKLAQNQSGPDAAWVHAYLHRQEGDPSNARYWYNRAGKDTSHLSPQEEWKTIAVALLKQ